MVKIINTVLFCLFALYSHAQEQKLHISLKSGNHVSISIADQPKIVFENGVMSVGKEDFLVSNVVKYVIGSDEVLTSVNTYFSDVFTIDANDAANGNVLINNYSGQAIKMYSANGTEVPCKVSINAATAKVDYSSLPTGIYILNVGKENIKIQKR